MNKQHILVWASFYPSNVRPQTGIFFKDQVEALRNAGHQVGVLVAPRIRETVDHIQRHRQLPNLRTVTTEPHQVYRMHFGWFPRVFPLICAALHTGAGWRAYRHYCDQHGTPDIIHAHNMFYAGYMAARIGQRTGIPVILTEHSSNHLRGRIFLPGQHIVARYTLNHVKQTLAVSPALASYLNQRYNPPTPAHPINNMVDTDFFVPGPQTTDEPFTIVAVGQLKSVKRFDLLLRAFAQVVQDKPARLIIGGRGPEKEKLIALAQSLDIEKQVEFPGLLSREEVRDLFQRAHVVVSSSHTETFGLTLVESMSCGKPVIATRSGGPQHFVTPETGILVPVNNIEALAEALTRMHDTIDTYDAITIRNYCVANFSQTAIVSQLEALYQQHQ